MKYEDYVEIIGQMLSEIDIPMKSIPDYKIDRMAAIMRDQLEIISNR